MRRSNGATSAVGNPPGYTVTGAIEPGAAPGTARGHGLRRLLARGGRPLRFALTGGAAACVQLCTLAALRAAHWPALTANVAAFLLAAQLNFALSIVFTWRDRGYADLRRRWLLFHSSIAGMALLNMAVFLAAHTRLPDLAASAAGIAAAAVGNYGIGDRLVFRAGAAPVPDPADVAEEAA